jgi:glycosyltransferase involved in cell wall biosynthesis
MVTELVPLLSEERRPTVSVVLPAYDESDSVDKTLIRVFNLMENTKLPYEIVFVDDGSRDDTRQKAMKFAKTSRLRVVGYSENMGKGYALKHGTMYVSGDYVVFLDSDMDIGPVNMERYLECARDADFAIASKRHPESRVIQPSSRKMLSLAFHVLVRVLIGVPVSDSQTGLKVCRIESLRKVLPLLAVKQYAFDVEMLTVAHLLRMKIIELPVNIHMGSHFNLKSIARMFLDILGIAYRLRIIRWYQKSLRRSNIECKPFANLQ